jgi:hypothetical protein
MTSLLKLPHVWKTLKEADLAAIRHDAERRFEVLVVAEDAAEGRGLAERLTGADRPHPWLTLATPEDARDRAAATGLDAAILVSPVEDCRRRSARRDASGAGGSAANHRHPGRPYRDHHRPARGGRPRRSQRGDEAGLPALARAVVAAFDPTLRLALARQLHRCSRLAWAPTIDETAGANATYALTTGLAEAVPTLDVPLNLADMVVLPEPARDELQDRWPAEGHAARADPARWWASSAAASCSAGRRAELASSLPWWGSCRWLWRTRGRGRWAARWRPGRAGRKLTPAASGASTGAWGRGRQWPGPCRAGRRRGRSGAGSEEETDRQ